MEGRPDSLRRPPILQGPDASAPVRGFSLIEAVVFIVVLGILGGAGMAAFSRFGTRGKTRHDAEQIVNGLWELRSRATQGMRNPCMDFPTNLAYRLYGDTTSVPDGFGIGDTLLSTQALKPGIRLLSVTGGTGSSHYVCFESKGIMGSASAALVATIGWDSSNFYRVVLLPATGIAKIK